MKKIVILFAVIMATISCSNAQQKEFSKDALQGKLTTVENKEITFKEVLEKHKGKTVVVEIWAGWCGDCAKAMPKVKELQANNPDVVYVFISMDKAFDKWTSAIAKHELKGDHYWVNDEKGMKGSFGKSIDLDWIPRYIVINKKGEIELYRAIETDFDKINTTLKTLK
ncbi:TlpA disulfide reductase family protein [Flavobacterium sp. SUN052]|uniref:TlpA family protein disulfide reductase n=1 Tax=Flavobacterium sp. SUN052 TaxID=3002441 RepID=UPI00237D55DF|nr:TlpA disulfide reductase family protein [Flavobacterium sp. SUN052]MEC4003887.1 TlpA disulfide reductase family protein [Flavobacterium sp. SUN052]